MKQIFKTMALGLTLSLTSLMAGATVKAELQSPPPNSTIESSTIQFKWDNVGTSINYWLTIGTTEGGDDVYNQRAYYVPVKTVRNIPITGKPIYVKIGTDINGHTEFNSYVLQTKALASKLISPAYGIKVSTDSLDFKWEDTGADAYHLEVGTTKGGHELLNYEGTDTSMSLENVPQNQTLYVTLSTKNGEVWETKSYEFGAGSQTVVDSLVLYSPEAKEMYPDIEARITHLIGVTNKIYRDSGLNVELNPVHIESYDIDESKTFRTNLRAIRATNNKEVVALRNKYGADNVIVYRKIFNEQSYVGGIATPNYLPLASGAVNSIVGIDGPAYLTAHEVGHTMGLAHDATQIGERAFMYARGHGEINKFITVMAYGSHFYSANKIYKYSSPKLDCDGHPCGIEEGEENSADAVKALRYVIPIYANFRAHVENEDEKRLSDTLKAYKAEQESVERLTEEVAQSREAYLAQQKSFREQRDEYKNAKKAFIQARNDRREAKISKEELATIKASFVDIRAKFISSRTLLKERYNLWTKTQTALAEAQEKLKELEAKYLALKG